jgi:hypothetical protein
MGDQLALDFDGPRMTVEEQTIWGLLGHGRDHAVGAAWLAHMVGEPERRIRQVVRHLIMHHNISIATAVDQPTGFYLPANREERTTAVKGLRHRGIMILVRAAKLDRLSLEEEFQQGRFEFDEEQDRGTRREG